MLEDPVSRGLGFMGCRGTCVTPAEITKELQASNFFDHNAQSLNSTLIHSRPQVFGLAGKVNPMPPSLRIQTRITRSRRTCLSSVGLGAYRKLNSTRLYNDRGIEGNSFIDVKFYMAL